MIGISNRRVLACVESSTLALFIYNRRYALKLSASPRARASYRRISRHAATARMIAIAADTITMTISAASMRSAINNMASHVR